MGGFLYVVHLGRQSYTGTWALQKEAARARITGELPEDVLFLVEHPPVVTMGRSAKEAHLIASPALLQARGVELHDVERGGDVTFHGPGQLVGYPIVDLKRHRKDLHWYLRQVEEALIRTAGRYGVEGERNPGYTGAWTQGRKLASIGVHARDWVTWHGFALNVTTDLSWFDLIVPCGIQSVTMTTLAAEAGRPALGLDEVGAAAGEEFAAVFGLDALRRPVEKLPGVVLDPAWLQLDSPRSASI
jgi:lipoyl(octanoyl) transferase